MPDLTKHFDGPVAYGGKQAFRLAAEVLRQAPEPGFTELLVNGRAQYYAAKGWDEAADLLGELGEVEDQLADHFSNLPVQ